MPDPIETAVRAAVAKVLSRRPEELSLDAELAGDLGADSMDVLGIIEELEKTTQLEIPSKAADELATLQDAIDYLRKLASES